MQSESSTVTFSLQKTLEWIRQSFSAAGQWALEVSIDWLNQRNEQMTSEVALRALFILLTVCFGSFVFVACFSFARRWLAGATISDLLANGCYEWLPGRGVHFVVYGCIWIFMVASGFSIAAAVIRLLAQFDNKRMPDWVSAIVMLVGATISFLLTRALYRFYSATFIDIKKIQLPRVKVSVKSIRPLRDAGDTSRIGTERFPNVTSPFFGIGLLTRRVLRLAATLALAIQLFIVIPLNLKTERPMEWLNTLILWQGILRDSYHSLIHAVRSWELPKVSCLVGIYFASVLLIILLKNNRHYLLLRFSQAACLSLALAAAIWIQVCNLGIIGSWNFATVYTATFILLWLMGRRWKQDLLLAAKYQRTRSFLSPIQDLIQNSVHLFLARVQKDRYCRLPDLNAEQLAERITRGAHNIEESDPFVTRLYGRFMRIARVATERCTTASLRFMTINRFTELGNYWPSYGGLRDPSVPVWDETRFPIHAPDGFVTRRDSIRLPDAYNPIYYCPTTETKTETYEETEYYTEWDSNSNSSVSKSRTVQRTRQVQVTCSKCNGCGRLEYARYLVTTWQTHRPTVASPHMSMPELVENAEEVIYFRRPLVERGNVVRVATDQVIGEEPLKTEMRRAGDRLASKTTVLCEQIVKLTQDRYVYRADFIVGGLHAMNIRFAFLRSRSGWFFGKRPEFHFPRLPIGWATIATWMFLSPLAGLVWLTTVMCLMGILAWVLHGPIVPSF
jgi:hypothetical protein